MIGRWWRGRTLHARLSLLVTAAVAAAVVVLSAGAFLAVAEIQRQQMRSQLTADARAIAAHPDQWLSAPDTQSGTGPGGPGHRGDRRRGQQLGPRWQILKGDASVAGVTGTPLPVTDDARRIATGGGRGLAEERVTVGDGDYVMLTVPATGGGAVQVALDAGEDDRVLVVFGVLLIIGCVAGIGAAALLGRVVARSGLRPVQRLATEVENVAVTMDLERPLDVQGADEVARLGASVNTLLGAIGTARRAQRMLVEDAGHELRTPLTSLRTNIELLLAVERNPDLAHRLPRQDRANLLADLEAQIGELTRLTTELVRLARAETAREDPEDVDLAEVVEAAVARVRMRAPTLTFGTELDRAVVRGRPGELERMVVNVLDNAAKWSPPDGGVRVVLRGTGESCELRVTDDGPGIEEDDRPHVFDRFYRAAAARSMPGSGLGLAIVAQTAEQHGGTVTTAPNHPHGTVVTITLPVVQVTPSPG